MLTGSYRFLLSVLFFSISCLLPSIGNCEAHQILEGDFDFEYRAPAESHTIQVTKEALASLIGLQLEADGFFSTFWDSTTQDQSAISKIDAIYLKPNYDQWILLKVGVIPVQTQQGSILNQLIRVAGGLLFHGKTPGGLGYALYFKGLQDDEAIHRVS